MTIEADAIVQQYTVGGTGPYAVLWPYLAGTLVVSVDVSGIVTPLAAADFTATPTEGASGDVFLSAAAAASYAGRQLFITRATPAEQGWQGVLGERERGLEAQLDRIVMLMQELSHTAATSLRIQGATPQPAYVTTPGVLMWDGSTLDIGPDAAEIEAAQGFATAAHADMLAAAASAAAAATFNPALFLAKADNLAGLGNVLTALTTGLGFSSYMAGLRGTPSVSALWTALGLGSIAARSSLLFTDIAAAAVRLSSEGYTGLTDTELATAAFVAGYIGSQALGLGQDWVDVSGSRTYGTSYQNTTNRPIQLCIALEAVTTGRFLQWSPDNTNWYNIVGIPENGTDWVTVSAVIPAGRYYRVNGQCQINGWGELR